MNKFIINIVRWIWYLLLIVGSFGIVVALIGLVFKNDAIYYSGLLFSSPFYLILLPICLLLMFIFCCRYASCKKHSSSKDEGEMDNNLAEK